MGYDTVQLWDDRCVLESPEGGTRGRPCFAEIISCHPACLALPLRKGRSSGCVPGQSMRTGLNAQLECACNETKPFLNCDLTSPELTSVVADDAFGKGLVESFEGRLAVLYQGWSSST